MQTHIKQAHIKYASFSMERIAALVLRQFYLIKHSWPRLIELTYWPLMQVTMWGFLQGFLYNQSAYYISAEGLLIAAIILWDSLVRANFGFTISFLEEMWSRNIGHLILSPLRPVELIIALIIVSIFRVFIGIIPAIVFVYFAFDYNFFSIGFALIPLFISLFITSWVLGIIVIGIIIRFGLGAESFAWTLPFSLLPFVCVFYPLDVLPQAAYYIASSLPPTYIFEALRDIVINDVFRYELIVKSLVLNMIYLAFALKIFYFLLDKAREKGKLLQTGE